MNNIAVAKYIECDNAVAEVTLLSYENGDDQLYKDFIWLANRGAAVYAYNTETSRTLATTEAYKAEYKRVVD